MNTIEINILAPESLHDLLIAELDELGCEGFVQDPDSLKAYVSEQKWTSQEHGWLEQVLNALQVNTRWKETIIPPQDWNEPWEKSIQPIQVGSFLIRPSWATLDLPADADLQEIIIDPKMSFGTGHHETTRLILHLLPGYISQDARVLDAGSGTAILSIAAIKAGAGSSIAFDIDTWAIDNGQENIRLNEVDKAIELRLGSFETIKEDAFDVVLANINRNVLIEYASALSSKLADNGTLILSGVLREDRPLMIETFLSVNLHLIDESYEGAWWAGIFRKRNNSEALSS